MESLVSLIEESPELLILGSLALPVLIILLHAIFGREEPAPREAPPAERRAVAEAAPPAVAEAAPPAVAEAAPPAVVEPAEVAVPPAEPEAVPEVEAPPEPVAEAPPPPRVRLADRLRRTSEALVGRIEGVLGGRTVDNDLLDDLEALLFGADLGVQTAEGLLQTVRKEAAGGEASSVRAVLRTAIRERLAAVEGEGDPFATRGKPHVVLVLGVNGSGKTTTIGKLAARFQAAGHKVILGAGDTFRAAAIEQLQVWGERVGCDVVASREGGDPAAVAFDTLKAAVARGCDVAIVDTAGRLQTKEPLMEELKKIRRVIAREVEGAPHEVLLVLDGNTGQNAISQARTFTEATGVTGLVVTKLDGTAKGGVIVGLADQLHIPVRFIGVGEAVEDLREFHADEFVDALFDEGGASA
jgi:fused signal recognition particle receptor